MSPMAGCKAIKVIEQVIGRSESIIVATDAGREKNSSSGIFINI